MRRAGTPTLLAAALFGSVAACDARADALVEVVLAAPLDEPRGYCLDIVGHQKKARPEGGLQAHSCYSYQGRLGVDQAFDAARLAAGEFRLPAFAVCVAASALQPGASLALSPCDGSDRQRFSLPSGGHIVPEAAAHLCLTVADGVGRPGGGGKPVHLLRQLTLERCDAARAAHQAWRLRARAE
jgi:hypothetical protein